MSSALVAAGGNASDDAAPVLKERLVEANGITYKTYTTEKQLDLITEMMKRELSEPYSIYTYRYFVNQWPELCWMVCEDSQGIGKILRSISHHSAVRQALDGDKYVGAIVCKQDEHKGKSIRGYIAMLAVDKEYRGRGIGTSFPMHP